MTMQLTGDIVRGDIITENTSGLQPRDCKQGWIGASTGCCCSSCPMPGPGWGWSSLVCSGCHTRALGDTLSPPTHLCLPSESLSATPRLPACAGVAALPTAMGMAARSEQGRDFPRCFPGCLC